MFAVVLDTCVLWPSLQRDFLLSLAIENLYRPLWSAAILAELEYHEASKLVDRGADPGVAAGQARRLIDQMTGFFDDALVEGWEPLDGTFGLPDPDDEHLVAAAVIGGAGAIVTDNIRDLPAAQIPGHIHVIKPAAFAADTVAVSPDSALRALQEMALRHVNPPRTVDELLSILEDRYSMTEAVEMIRNVA